MVDVHLAKTSQIGFMLSAMKKGQTAGGTKTWTSTFSNSTEALLLSTGLTEIHGLILCCPTYPNGVTLGAGLSNIHAFFWRNYDEDNNPLGTWGFGYSQNNSTASGYCSANTRQDNAPFLGVVRFDGGNIYYTGRYNNNNNYQIVRTNLEYEWLAW